MKKFNLKINKTKTLILIAIVTLLVFVSGITYAYFQTQGNNGANANVNVLSSSTDNLIFTVEKDIYINASVANFGEGMGDLSDDTNATATLIPNNYDNTASAMYNIYIIIEANNLEYTTPNNTPELLLNVTDPNGNKLENITGLVHYEQGFDITTRTGGFLIASDYVIEANNATEVQNWNIEITLANLDSNQNANTGKNFSAKIYMTQEKMSSYNPVQITNIEATPTYNTIDTNLILSNGSADVDKYYFGIKEASSEEEVNYIESETPNYEFSNLKDNTEYIIYSYAVDVNNVKSNVYETRVTTNEYALATISEVTHSVTLNSITLTVNATSGDGTITKYMYSNNDGESWVESDSNTYTFTDLSDTTEYKIRVKVVDSNGVESTEYYEAIATETYILPVVANVEYTTTYNSITLTPSGTDGTNTIDHYLYSIDNGEYQTSNVFSNLTEQTEYTINVKAIDINGRESNPYTIQITTDTYEIPEITNVSTSSTENSITINVSANNGDGTITRYLYSRDNGSNWYESTSSSYTFNNLTSDTTFYIQVKVVDNNNRESAVYNTTETTLYINPVVNSVSTSNITSSSITLTVNATAGSKPIQTYYYSNNNGSSYVSSTSNTYTFSGLSGNTTYNFRVYVRDSNNINSNVATTSGTTLVPTLANWVIEQYGGVQGNNGIYYHTSSLANSAEDNSYRYSGGDYKIADRYKNSYNNIYGDLIKYYCNGTEQTSFTGMCMDAEYYFVLDYENNIQYDNLSDVIQKAFNDGYLIDNGVNNYVCFGSNASTCPYENLYRIIGVFDNEVKLIKADFSTTNTLGTNGNYSLNLSGKNSSTGFYKGQLELTSISNYYFNNTNSFSSPNSWDTSSLRTINLNTNYLNNIGNEWNSKIANHTWEVGGMVFNQTYNAKQYFDVEINNADNNREQISNKIGLIYVSDYAFAITPEYWTYSLYNDYHNVELRANNWLYLGYDEWTISKNTSRGTPVIIIQPNGRLGDYLAGFETPVRPTFYLNSTVQYVSGTGTSSNPIRIN